MKGKLPKQNQGNLLRPILKEVINPIHELVVLAQRINWQCFEDEFNFLYSHTSQPRIPVLTIVGLLPLKRIYNLGDEKVMEQWVQNPYFQYFCGATEFQWEAPCDPSDRVHFRKRIGEQGAEKILEMSMGTRKGEVKKPNDVLINTKDQDKDITYLADNKLFIKVVKSCNKIVNKEEVEQRKAYQKTIKKILLKQYFTPHPKQKKEVGVAMCNLRTIADSLVQELERKLEKEALGAYKELLGNFHKNIEQKKSDNNKIYGLHESDKPSIAKGKAHKKIESDSKVSFAPAINIIVVIKNFNGTPNDTSTLEPALENVEKESKVKFKNAIVDRSYKEKEVVCDTMIVTPRAPPLSSLTAKYNAK